MRRALSITSSQWVYVYISQQYSALREGCWYAMTWRVLAWGSALHIVSLAMVLCRWTEVQGQNTVVHLHNSPLHNMSRRHSKQAIGCLKLMSICLLSTCLCPHMAENNPSLLPPYFIHLTTSVGACLETSVHTLNVISIDTGLHILNRSCCCCFFFSP